MYDIIQQIIGHTYSGSYYTSEEQLITTIVGVIITIVLFIFIDLIYRIFRSFMK